MNKVETLALFAKGKDAWNAWAEEILVQKQATTSEDVLDWKDAATARFGDHFFNERCSFAHFIFPCDARFDGATFAKGAEFVGTEFLAYAVFYRVTFRGSCDFSQVKFVGKAIFDQSKFLQETVFDQANFVEAAGFFRTNFGAVASFCNAEFVKKASFAYAIFAEDIEFDRAKFASDIDFTETEFMGYSSFFEAAFGATAKFYKTKFNGIALLDSSKFDGDALFIEAKFMAVGSFRFAEFARGARFTKARFAFAAWFESAKFGGETVFVKVAFVKQAQFSQTRFGGYTIFAEARFEGLADFVAAQGEGSFSLEHTTFIQLPDFGQAHFSEAPQLGNAIFPVLAHTEGEAERWRSLKRLALQGHDHDRELLFFSNELKATRGVTDRAFPHLWNGAKRLYRNICGFFGGAPAKEQEDLPVWRNSARYWFGLLYEIFSNFGRSMLRPVFWWLAVTFAFATSYWRGSLNDVECVGGGGNSMASAAYLALHKGLIVPGIGTPEFLSKSYACLYGFAVGGKTAGAPPYIPDYVAFLGMLQTLLSATLIFLFLLAVRNHFRIR